MVTILDNNYLNIKIIIFIFDPVGGKESAFPTKPFIIPIWSSFESHFKDI